RQSKNFYIYEVIVPINSFIKNGFQQRYLFENVISLYHKNAMYSPIGKTLELDNRVESFSLPGHEWVYFEIYGHPTFTQTLLITKIYDYIKITKQKIKQWFFIRYSIPSPHIRIRIQLKNVYLFHEIISGLSAILDADLRIGLIKDLQIKPYVREIERYGIS